MPELRAAQKVTHKVEYSVVTRCPRSRIWPLYLAWHEDHRYRPIFHELRWTEGKSWEPRSRLEVHMIRPFPFIVRQVITSCVPGEKVTWINHSMGVATEQWITFESLPDDSTRISTWVEIMGSQNPFSWPIDKLVMHIIKGGLDSIQTFCDQSPAQSV